MRALHKTYPRMTFWGGVACAFALSLLGAATAVINFVYAAMGHPSHMIGGLCGTFAAVWFGGSVLDALRERRP